MRATQAALGALLIGGCGASEEEPPPATTPVFTGDCGVVWEGEFDEVGVRQDDDGLDRVRRPAEGGWDEFVFTLPDEDIHRITFVIEGEVALFGRRPGADDPELKTPLVDLPPVVRLDRTVGEEHEVVLDFDSTIDLPAFQAVGPDTPWVVAATAPGPYRVEAMCTEGPILDSFRQILPTNAELFIQPLVHGFADPYIDIIDGLPPGLEFRNGTFTGTATTRAERPTGRDRPGGDCRDGPRAVRLRWRGVADGIDQSDVTDRSLPLGRARADAILRHR